MHRLALLLTRIHLKKKKLKRSVVLVVVAAGAGL
jgi:hypothetical protein